MRSRYSAFVLGLPGYLLDTWHRSTRPPTLTLDDGPHWTSLEVLRASERDQRGSVHFRAIYKTEPGWGYLEEVSDFVRERGRWYYLSGQTREGRLAPGRNDPCPCGSQRKFKVCCNAAVAGQ